MLLSRVLPSHWFNSGVSYWNINRKRISTEVSSTWQGLLSAELKVQMEREVERKICPAKNGFGFVKIDLQSRRDHTKNIGVIVKEA